MEREKLDLREKLLEKKQNSELKHSYILRDLFFIGDEYRLPEESYFSLESLFLNNMYGLRFDNICDSMWLRITNQAKIYQKENQPFPESMKNLKNLDELRNKCILLENKDKKYEENFNKKHALLLKEKWYQTFKRVNNSLEKTIDNYNKLLYKEFDSKNKYNAHKISALENTIIKEIESIKTKHPEIPAVVWDSVVEKREYPLNEGSKYRINRSTSSSKAHDIISEKLKTTYPKIFNDHIKFNSLLHKTRLWIDKLYNSSFGLDHNEKIYRIIKNLNNDQWYENFEGELLKPLSEIELKKSIIDADIPLTENENPTFPGYGFVENRPSPLKYGFYDYEKSRITKEFAIMPIGINFRYLNWSENESIDISWLLPNNHADRVTLLKQIQHIIEKSGIYTVKRKWQKTFDKNLLKAGLIDKIFSYFQEDGSQFNNDESLKIEKILFTSKPFQDYRMFGYLYFKRSLNKEIENKFNNVVGIHLELLKFNCNNKKTIYSFFLSDNDYKTEYCLNYQVDNLQDFLSILKILDQTMKDENFLRIDEIFNKKSLDLIYQKGKDITYTIFEGINEFFLKSETFDFNIDSVLDQITEYPTIKGTNWKQYVEEYKLTLEGKTQDEIAIKYKITQQAISNHRQKLKGELARITGEAYEKWLEDKYKTEPDVIKVLRKGGKGEPDLIIFRKNNLIEVINAKAYTFSLSRPTFTIPAKEYQPEIEKARKLEKEEKDVTVYIDFFNLYNKERYPRIIIDHNKPPEKITIRFEDYIK